MNNDAFASGALFARTAAGNAELTRPASSLSVPQRKLLLLIQQGADYSTLVDSGPAPDRDRRRRDLLRLVELQLVSEVDANGLSLPARVQPGSTCNSDPLSRFGGVTLVMPPPPSPNAPRTQLGATASEPVAAATRAGDASGRRGPTVAIVAIVGAAIVGGASWWLMHVGSDAPVAGRVAQSAPPPDHRAPPLAPTPVATAPAQAIPASTQPPALLAAATLPAPVAPAPALERGLKLTPNPVAAAPAPGQAATPKPQQVVAPAIPPIDARAAGKKDGTPAKDATTATTPAPAATNALASAPLPPTQPASAPARSESGPAPAAARIEPAANSGAPANNVAPATTAPPASAPAVDPSRPVARPPGPVAGVAASAQQPAPASTAPTLATAAPTSSPAATPPPPQSAPRILSRVNPDFPREAAIAGVTTGTIKARMRIAADGTVTGVEIVQANPERVFDRAVTRALSQWKFEPTGAARTVDHEVEFR